MREDALQAQVSHWKAKVDTTNVLLFRARVGIGLLEQRLHAHRAGITAVVETDKASETAFGEVGGAEGGAGGREDAPILATREEESMLQGLDRCEAELAKVIGAIEARGVMTPSPTGKLLFENAASDATSVAGAPVHSGRHGPVDGIAAAPGCGSARALDALGGHMAGSNAAAALLRVPANNTRVRAGPGPEMVQLSIDEQIAATFRDIESWNDAERAPYRAAALGLTPRPLSHETSLYLCGAGGAGDVVTAAGRTPVGRRSSLSARGGMRISDEMGAPCGTLIDRPTSATTPANAASGQPQRPGTAQLRGGSGSVSMPRPPQRPRTGAPRPSPKAAA